MPPARYSSARAHPGPRPPAPFRVAERIRWDRVGRVGLLVTLAIVVCLYIQPAFSIFTTWRAEHRQSAVVHRLLRSNAALQRQVNALNQPSTIAAHARALGMVRLGEKPYVILGLPR